MSNYTRFYWKDHFEDKVNHQGWARIAFTTNGEATNAIEILNKEPFGPRNKLLDVKLQGPYHVRRQQHQQQANPPAPASNNNVQTPQLPLPLFQALTSTFHPGVSNVGLQGYQAPLTIHYSGPVYQMLPGQYQMLPSQHPMQLGHGPTALPSFQRQYDGFLPVTHMYGPQNPPQQNPPPLQQHAPIPFLLERPPALAPIPASAQIEIPALVPAPTQAQFQAPAPVPVPAPIPVASPSLSPSKSPRQQQQEQA